MRGYATLFVVIVALSCVFTTASGAEADSLGKYVVRACGTQERPVLPNQHNIYVHYENDKAWPRWSYANNREAHRSIVELVKDLSSERSNVRTIVIEGSASPVGSDTYNRHLALRRAKVLRGIISRMSGGDKLRIHAVQTGEDWATFSSYIEERYHEANREQVLAILRIPGSNIEKERRLHALDGGRTWRMLVNDFMASARNAAVIRIVEIEELAPKVPLFGVAPVQLDAVFESRVVDTVKVDTVVAEPRKPVVAVRSNLLVPALNVGVEVPIGTSWSVAADYYFPWVWPKRDNKNCFELLAWGIEGRYWFGRNRTVFDRLQGHSIGLYGYMGYYDFEHNFHGHQGEFVNVGLDYTYSMAVGKRKSVHFEFSLGVGCIYSQARKYTVIESHGPLISDKITKKVLFFGPTKANVSLVVPIFQKIKPNDKWRGNE